MKFDDDADAEIERCIKNTLKEDETKNTYAMARRVKKVSPKIKVSHTLHYSADDEEGTRSVVHTGTVSGKSSRWY